MDLIVCAAIYVTGKTARFEKPDYWTNSKIEGYESYENAMARETKRPAVVFWHDNIFLQTYCWSFKRVVALVSMSFHGEMIARAAQRLGFGMVRGSSTKDGSRAFNEMRRLAKRGHQILITVDGPLGPRHKAKPV